MKEAFLALVRLGIGNAITNSLPDRIDWDAVEAHAKQHGLWGVVYDGVVCHAVANDGTALLPLATKLRWIGEVTQVYEAYYAQYRKAVIELADFYHAHGFRMMVLKGMACGINWPKPEHRPYGDIDIYQFGQYKEADAVLNRELGIKIDNSHHHHTVFEWQGFTVENHYDFVNVHVHKSSREIETVLKELASQTLNEEVPPNLHALFLIRHMVSHFTGASMSLRQVLDWGFFVKAHHEEVDWPWLFEVLDKYHMKEFLDCVNAICVEDLGFNCIPLSAYSLPLKERILNDILEPEFSEQSPKHILKRVPFKYRRWKANKWKRELCYVDSQLRTLLGGVWNHMLKPAGI